MWWRGLERGDELGDSYHSAEERDGDTGRSGFTLEGVYAVDVRVGGQAVRGSAGSWRYPPWNIPDIVHLLTVILSSFDLVTPGVCEQHALCVGSP